MSPFNCIVLKLESIRIVFESELLRNCKQKGCRALFPTVCSTRRKTKANNWIVIRLECGRTNRRTCNHLCQKIF